MSEPRATMNHDSEYRAIEERAAEGFGRCERGLSPEQEKEFIACLQAYARYGKATCGADFRLGDRRGGVRLTRGEAHLAVAKDSSRPFIVTAGGVSVRAVGTAFNVRRVEQRVEVFVTEGKVRIDSAAKGESLLPRP